MDKFGRKERSSLIDFFP